MGDHRSGCLICGKPLQYFDSPEKLKCEKCGLEFESSACCEDRHFVCDACHAQAGYAAITAYALNSASRDPILIAREMMRDDLINMHGPEHHYLIVAALLAAYKNAGGQLDLEKALSLARTRAKKVPGGICGLWGCCGAGIGAGIFISIVTGASPMSTNEWRMANQMTSQSLEAIARNGGPRCCKRDVYLSILTVIDFVKEHLGLDLEKPASVKCSFFTNNPSCIKEACLFYPSAA